MQVEIIKIIQQVELIEVELPYYYKHDLMSDYGDSVIFGKIEEKLCTSIHEIENYDGEEKYEIQKNEHHSIKNSGLASYFDKKYNSTIDEYEAVKERCITFLNDY